jgi:hypothetical protein
VQFRRGCRGFAIGIEGSETAAAPTTMPSKVMPAILAWVEHAVAHLPPQTHPKAAAMAGASS